MKTMMPNLIFVYPFTQMHELDDQPQCTLVKKKEKKVRNLLVIFTEVQANYSFL